VADDVKQLLIRVSATTELLRSNLAKAESAIASFESDTNRKLAKVDGHFSKLGKGVNGIKSVLSSFSSGAFSAFVGVIAGGALVSAAKNALDYADAIGDVAAQLGVTSTFLQEFRDAAIQSDASIEDADAGLAKFTKTIGDAARGNSAAQKTFKSIGVDIIALTKAGASTGEIYRKVSDGIAQLATPFERVSAVQALFGRGAAALVPLLAAGGDGFEKLAKNAREAGRVISEDGVNKAGKTSKEIDLLNASLRANIATVVAENAESIEALVKGLISLVGWAGQGVIAWQKFQLVLERKGAQAQADSWFISAKDKLAALQRVSDLSQEIVDLGTPRAATGTNSSAAAYKAQAAAGAKPPAASNYFRPSRGPAKAGYAFPGLMALPLDIQSIIDTASGASGDAPPPRALAEITEEARRLGVELDDILPSLREFIAGQGETAYSDVYDKAGIDATGDFDAIIANIDRIRDAEFAEIESAAAKREDSVRTVSGLYTDLFSRGTSAVWDNFKSIGLNAVAEVMAKLTIGALSGQNMGSIGSLFSSALGAQGFGGFFAAGGSPPVGKASIVGERGPELFIPKVPGTIIANHQLGGAQQVVVEVQANDYFDARVVSISGPMATRGALAGAEIAGQRAQAAGRRRLG